MKRYERSEEWESGSRDLRELNPFEEYRQSQIESAEKHERWKRQQAEEHKVRQAERDRAGKLAGRLVEARWRRAGL